MCSPHFESLPLMNLRTACWALLFLSFHTDWKAKAKAEVDALIDKHTTNSSSEPFHKRLAAIHITAWEDEMPILELVIRETLRLSANGTSLRRNVSEDLSFAGGIVKRGDFVAYSVADVHSNPEIYSRPREFDPDRFGEGREEDKKGTFSYLGWGAGTFSICCLKFMSPKDFAFCTVGRHPCTGMKVAKLEIKIILAFMLASFEFDVVDKFGKRPKGLPKPDANDIQQVKIFYYLR